VRSYYDQCIKGYTGPRSTDLFREDYFLYVEYECDISEIEYADYDLKMNRTRLANIVISCDAIICIIFIINIMWMNRAINTEQFDVDKKFVHMTDFAVRVKNLPHKPSFDNLDQLKA